MPYRIDIRHPPSGALDALIHLGALDVEPLDEGIAAILPDSVTPQELARIFDTARLTVSTAAARDDNSVWLLTVRPVRVGSLLITSPGADAAPNSLRLSDSNAFGTGHHPTTALCIEAIEEIVSFDRPASILDVGTGSGILALTALLLGVSQGVGLDTDPQALETAAGNARLNNLADRLQLTLGGPEAVTGAWPLVVANLLAAPLMDLAPQLVRRLARRGRLILSGIPSSLEREVIRAYQHFGTRHIESKSRNGWTMIIVQASW